MKTILTKISIALMSIIFFVLLYSCNSNSSAKKKKYTLAWSVYTGWQPWDYADKSGIIKKWADKYNLEIELIKMDYVSSIDAYATGKADACVMTNMDVLIKPVALGIQSSAIILGDYSNGNDAILTRDNIRFNDLCGKEVSLEKLTVSHYLLYRALEINHISDTCAKLVNTSDANIAPAFISNQEQKVIITWNPMVMQILKEKGISNIFNSSEIPGEILDLMVVNTKTLTENPHLGRALVGAWYEVMDSMTINSEENKNKIYSIMAASAGCSIKDYKEQLKTTAMFYDVREAVKYISGSSNISGGSIINKMEYVRKFCSDPKLFNNNAGLIDKIGIKYPNGKIQGDQNNIQLFFDDSYMRLCLDKKL